MLPAGPRLLALWGVAADHATTAYIPVVIFAFLYGLSMDYEVFMISRMREAYDETGSTDKAIELGLARTGKLVTSAALILMFAFLVLSSSPGLRGEGSCSDRTRAGGIIFDATVIRALLLPSLMKLLGNWNWWMPGGQEASSPSRPPSRGGGHGATGTRCLICRANDVDIAASTAYDRSPRGHRGTVVGQVRWAPKGSETAAMRLRATGVGLSAERRGTSPAAGSARP